MRERIVLVAVTVLACNGTPARGQGGGAARNDDVLRVPPGFKISVFAGNLQGVRYLTLGPGNAIYASQPGSGLIVKLTDTNHGGVVDSVVTIASGLRGPFGIAFRGDTMYVAEEAALVRFGPDAREPV